MTFPCFTFGGLFYWQDKYSYAGWKIQENIWSHRCRVLDSYNVLRYQGTLSACRKKLDSFVENWEITPPSAEAVVILPGLFQRKKTFERMIKELKSVSFEVIFVSMPMFRFDVQQKTVALNKLLGRRPDIKKFHFIASGAGGLVLRQACAVPSLWHDRIGRTVLMSVPNNGFSWATKNKDKRLYKLFFGNMAKCLLPSYAEKIPLMTGEFATLNGGKGAGSRGFIPFVKGDDDGVLSERDTFHPNAKADFLIPDGVHFFLPDNQKAVDICKQFIQYGYSNKKRTRKNHSVMNLIVGD